MRGAGCAACVTACLPTDSLPKPAIPPPADFAMSDSENSTNAFTPSSNLYSGISVLSSGDWIQMTTFFESAVTDNPTTTELMRAMLGMQKQDAFRPEFSEAVELFVTLKGVGQKFKTDVQDKMLTLAEDIVQYNRSSIPWHCAGGPWPPTSRMPAASCRSSRCADPPCP